MFHTAATNDGVEEREQYRTVFIVRQLAVFIWLSYFNKYLFEEGTITEKEYSQMTEKIANYKPA